MIFLNEVCYYLIKDITEEIRSRDLTILIDYNGESRIEYNTYEASFENGIKLTFKIDKIRKRFEIYYMTLKILDINALPLEKRFYSLVADVVERVMKDESFLEQIELEMFKDFFSSEDI